MPEPIDWDAAFKEMGDNSETLARIQMMARDMRRIARAFEDAGFTKAQANGWAMKLWDRMVAQEQQQQVLGIFGKGAP